jgi:ketosteroid isomerase-like protein
VTSHEEHERRREIVRSFSEAGPDRWTHFAPDFRWRMIGTTPVSGVMVGVSGVAENMRPFGERIESMRVTVDDVIGEGDKFVKIAHSEGVTVTGEPYRNEYATVFRFEGNQIVDIAEYLDTALIEGVLTRPRTPATP